MVAKELIDVASQPCPVSLQPAAKTSSVWKSQTECQLWVTEKLAPRQVYRLVLNGGVTDHAGDPVAATAALGVYRTADLTVKINTRNSGDELDSKPQARLLFNYPVTFASATTGIYLQDRDSRERFATELIIPGVSGKLDTTAPPAPVLTSGTSFEVVAASPLPPGRTVDLIVDDVRSVTGKCATASSRGTRARPPPPTSRSPGSAVTTARSPTRRSRSRPASGSPSTPSTSSRCASSRRCPTSSAWLAPTTSRSRATSTSARPTLLTVGAPLASQAGYPLKAPQVKRIEFGGTHPAIFFPHTQFFQRAGLGLKVKFLHANTGEVTWNLAQIPPHQLSAVWRRVNEYKGSKIDPLTGNEVIDPLTGWAENVDTELLVEALGLEAIGTGILPGANSTRGPPFRDIQWKPAADPADPQRRLPARGPRPDPRRAHRRQPRGHLFQRHLRHPETHPAGPHPQALENGRLVRRARRACQSRLVR